MGCEEIEYFNSLRYFDKASKKDEANIVGADLLIYYERALIRS